MCFIPNKYNDEYNSYLFIHNIDLKISPNMSHQSSCYVVRFPNHTVCLTTTLTLGEMLKCIVCWSYCLCLEVLVDEGIGPVFMLASRYTYTYKCLTYNIVQYSNTVQYSNANDKCDCLG